MRRLLMSYVPAICNITSSWLSLGNQPFVLAFLVLTALPVSAFNPDKDPQLKRKC